MANVKISQLPAASTVTADVDVLPIVHSGVTEKVTPNQIVNKVLEAPGEIGGTTPGDATFTTLTAESSVFLNPANADVELSPTGSGRTLIQPEAGAIINPGVLSYMDNVAIGGTTPQAAVFTTLTSNSTTTLNGTTIPASKTLVDTDSVQTLSSKYYLNPRIWDWDQNNYYRISPLSPGLATDVYCYLPILTGNDYFSFRNFAETLTNKTISGLSNTLTDIPNSSFQYSSITLGSTSISLGGTASSITGLALTGGTVNNTAIGGTTASSGAFTTLSSTGNTTLGDASGDTLTINAGTTTFAQGTANGVLYLNGSNVATSGSGLVFDGTTVSTPSLSVTSGGALFTNNNGMYWNAGSEYFAANSTSHYLFWGASNSEQMRLTSKGLLVGYTSDSGLSGTGNAIFSGNVGIGTSSPSYNLSVQAASVNTTVANFSGANPHRGLTIKTFQSNAGDDCGVDFSAFASPYGSFKWTQATSTVMTLDFSGNLGLGVAPSAKFDVLSSAAYIQNLTGPTGVYTRLGTTTSSLYTVHYTTGSAIYTQESATLSFGTNGYSNRLTIGTDGSCVWRPDGTTSAMTLDASGNLLVGGTSTTENATVLFAVAPQSGTTYVPVVTFGVGGTLGTSFQGGWRWYTSTGNGGSVYKNGYNLQLRVYDLGSGAEATAATVTYQSWYQGNNSANWATTSDARLKENIRDIDVGLQQILALHPVRFDWKPEAQFDSKDVAGFVAQEVETVMPEMVMETSDGFKSLNLSALSPAIVKAIQELHQEIELLKAKVN